jgi:diguanylate cyclase
MSSLDGILDTRGLGWIAIWTIGGTVVCTGVSLIITYIFILPFGPEVLRVSLGLAFWIPILLAIPLFSYIGVKLQQLSQANYLLKKANRIDGLTQCLNRTTFTADVGQIFAGRAAGKTTGASGLLIIDADHFKQINDRFGHLVGDQVLISVASLIQLIVGDSGLVGRLGGEEFGVFLMETSPESLNEVAERIRQTVADSGAASIAPGLSVTVSIGGVCFGYPGQYQDVFRIADEQLYLAKHAGRNRVCLPDVSGREDLLVRNLMLAGRDLQRERAALPATASR